MESGNLVDDRPAADRGTFCRVLERLGTHFQTGDRL
jgi:hypothetical protein